MNSATIGFIGGGRIVRIMLDAWRKADALPSRIIISDPESRLATTTNNCEAAAQDIVIVALHPPVVVDALKACAAALKPSAKVISLAPKLTVATLGAALGGLSRVARMIPNAPSIIGAGYNPISFGVGFNPSDVTEILELFSPLGECPVVEERKLEAYALLTARGPTYFWFQLEELREMATSFGLSDTEVATALKRMVCGATRTLLESGLSPAEVMDLVPVKPFGENEPAIREFYRVQLPLLYEKIQP
jgi:pyrroline-5-carboxylate reductase